MKILYFKGYIFRVSATMNILQGGDQCPFLLQKYFGRSTSPLFCWATFSYRETQRREISDSRGHLNDSRGQLQDSRSQFAESRGQVVKEEYDETNSDDDDAEPLPSFAMSSQSQ